MWLRNSCPNVASALFHGIASFPSSLPAVGSEAGAARLGRLSWLAPGDCASTGRSRRAPWVTYMLGCLKETGAA
eukprot:1832956-Heterocapsa_arctica.AAC.1